VDPVSRREFWDTLAHLAGQGLTVLVATPYLDEAERCHRIALIHLGEIKQIERRMSFAKACTRNASNCARPIFVRRWMRCKRRWGAMRRF